MTSSSRSSSPVPKVGVLYTLEAFLRTEAASGVLLLLCAVISMMLANMGSAWEVHAFWQSPWSHANSWLGGSHEGFVNDRLMVLFFFVAGLEIRRELHRGELSEWRRAALPVVAAVGGMVVPALVYLAGAGAPLTRAGWGVPMATDIAFALGALSLIGKRVPPALRVLLLALAVIDDLGAIVVLALFYPQAGHVHPTVYGVALGLLLPPGKRADACLVRLHPWVAYGVMPAFALANAGVSLQSVSLRGASFSVTCAVAAGLVLGKPLGVLGTSWLAVRAGLARLPLGLRWPALWVLGLCAGVGLTMSLFVARLAFPQQDLLAAAKLGVLLGSALMAVLAVLVGRAVLPREHLGARTADEAEASTEL